MDFWFPADGILSILIIRSESDTEEKYSGFSEIFNLEDREQKGFWGYKPDFGKAPVAAYSDLCGGRRKTKASFYHNR